MKMEICRRCPTGDGCRFVCRYCSKNNVYKTTKQSKNANNSDRCKQFINELKNNELSFTDLSDEELQYLFNIVVENMSRRVTFPPKMTDSAAKRWVARRVKGRKYSRQKTKRY